MFETVSIALYNCKLLAIVKQDFSDKMGLGMKELLEFTCRNTGPSVIIAQKPHWLLHRSFSFKTKKLRQLV